MLERIDFDFIDLADFLLDSGLVLYLFRKFDQDIQIQL